jgi:hypothetical protein
MSIKNLRSEKRQPKLSPHTRLALSVIGRAVEDIKNYDASRHRSAARFLNGSETFYFWANVLEQDSNWLLRGLHTRLREDSPQAFRRLSRYAGPQGSGMPGSWDFDDAVMTAAHPATRAVPSHETVAAKPASDRVLPHDSTIP